MDFIENWECWQPLKSELLDHNDQYDLCYISNDIEKEFIIVLEIEHHKDKQNIKIIFSNSIKGFRKTYTSFREHTYYELSEKYGYPYFNQWSFFKVYNSEYLKWLCNEAEIDSIENLTHFSILTTEFIIDIIADYEPKVEFLINDNKS